MKCIIIYFSQSGNTEKIATAIHRGASQSIQQCDLVKIADADPRNLHAYDLIGIGSPVIGGAPDNVLAFIDEMRGVGGKHVFVFYTHGALPMLFLPTIYPRLTQRGLVVIGAANWYGGCWLAHCTKPYFTDGHPDEIDLKEAEAFGSRMVAKSRTGESALAHPKPPALSDIPMPLPPEFMGVFSSKIRFHEDQCNFPKCRLCMEHCPVNGIDLSLSPPLIANPCIDCEMCTKICPTGAMEAYDFYGWITPIFYNAMRLSFFATMRKAEEAGNFRRLVKERDLGFDSPVSKMILDNRNRHPYFKVRTGFTLGRRGKREDQVASAHSAPAGRICDED